MSVDIKKSTKKKKKKKDQLSEKAELDTVVVAALPEPEHVC